MALLIDDSGARRLLRNLQTQAQEERERFRQAVQEAVGDRARASDDPRLDRQQPQERLVVVERGDTLNDIAADHEVTLPEVAQLNPQVDNLDHIETGEVLFLPPPSPTELAQRPDGEALFLDDLYTRGNAIEYADAGTTDHQAEIDTLVADVGEYLGALPEGERKAAAQRLFDEDWTDAGPAQMAIEQGADAQGIVLEPSSHAGSAIETQARERVAAAQAKTDPLDRLATLNDGFETASPEVRQAMLRSPGAREIVQGAADQALSALTEAHEDAVDPHVYKSYELFRRLDEMSADLDPQLTSELAEAVLPGLEEAFAESIHSDFGALRTQMQGTHHLLQFTGRLDPQADATTLDRFSAMGFYHMHAFAPYLGEGGSLNYPLSLVGHYEGEMPTMVTEGGILAGLEQNQARVRADIGAYGNHLAELNWLEQNGGSVMTDAQLAEAVDGYIEGQVESAKPGEEDWQTKADNLRAQVAEDGRQLLDNLASIEARYPGLFEGEGDLETRLQTIENESERDFARQLIQSFDTPETTIAMGVALDADPSLLTDPSSMRLVGQYGKLTDRGRKFVEETATQIIRRTVVPELAQLDPSNPNSVQRVHNALDRFDTQATGRLLGISDGDLDKALKIVKDALAQPGETPAQAQARLQRMDAEFERLTTTRDGIRAFNRETAPGQVLRLLGVIGSTATTLSSHANYQNDPNLWTGLKVTLDAAGVAQKTTEVLMGAGMIERGGTLDNLVGGSNRMPVKILGVLTSAFDFYNAKMAADNNDPAGAAIYTATGVGGVMAAVGTGSLWGPIGAGIVLVGTGIHMKYDQVKKANEYQTDITIGFLRHAGFSETAAQALSDQSGEGYSVLPLLERYANSRGLDLDDAADQQAFVDWINAMPADRLGVLRDNLHRSLDEVDNDLAQIPDASEDDEFFAFNNTDRPHFTYSGYATPLSMNQLDVTLDILGLQPLVS
ncbi:LysM peptidoglycan-binding domain-containing protein [Stutzerimonas urumqiensis]|uniref:LysM peptidoglycan-binding domain-containing protein n=1 Tax=Stutzerimonas urumqiensis TaxID=638269 RepID=UPI000EB3FC51|nr:LysM domain-containing protein [Stutzerimonas urumqiensis]